MQDNIRAEDLILVMYRSKCERRVTQGASRGQPLSACFIGYQAHSGGSSRRIIDLVDLLEVSDEVEID